MIPIFGLMHIGDGSMTEGITNLYNSAPERFNAIGDRHASVPFTTIFTGMMLVQLFYWGTNQAIIQRALAARDLREGQKGLLLAAFFKILGPLILVLPGMIAFYLFKGDLAIPDQAYPKLVKTVLPVALVGFFAAVLFGAILSSFNSALNSSVTLFGLDIYKEHINPDASQETIIKQGKRFGLLLAFLSMFVAPFIAKAPDGLFGYLQEINGCYSIPILTIIVVGYLTKWVPPFAAKFAIISGSIFYSISQFWLKGYFVDKAVSAAERSGITDPLQLDRIGIEAYPHFLHVLAILFAANVIIMLIIGKLRPQATAYELVHSKDVDITPYKFSVPFGIGIVVVVVCSYVYFS